MNQIEIYQTKDKQTQVEVNFQEDTVWLTQKQMAELFGRDRVADKKSVCKDFLPTASDNKSYKTKYYNLDVIVKTVRLANDKNQGSV